MFVAFVSGRRAEYPCSNGWDIMSRASGAAGLVMLVALAACGSDKGTVRPSVSGSGTGGAGRPSAGSSSSAGYGGSSGSAAASGGAPTTPAAGQSGTSSGRSGAGGAAAGSGGAPAGSGGATAGSSGAAAAGRSGSGGQSGGGAGGAGAPASGSGGSDAGMSMTEEDAGVCMPLANPLNVGGFALCSPEICPGQDSRCVDTSLLKQLMVAQSAIDLLADCNAMQKCVPQSVAEGAGRAIATSCTSILGAEGRCTSQCVPIVAQQAAQLPKDVCEGNDLCAPCFDPRTGADTLACRQGCDPGPTQPPKTFAKCCSSRGLCVPPSLAGTQAPNLAKDSCSGELLCAPTELTDTTFIPKSCYSIDNAEGRCVSTCIGGAVAKQRDRLPTAGCGANEVCAPCYDPITGADTGACAVNGDTPRQPKYQFQACCTNAPAGPAGVCVTPELAGDQAEILRQESCPDGRLCAPVKKAEDPKYRFPSCTGLGTGACINSCILDPAQAGILGRASCAQGEVCAPCAILGQSTGACD